jgi:hypothetical protein
VRRGRGVSKHASCPLWALDPPSETFSLALSFAFPLAACKTIL